jgi:hypothetical protein
MEVIREVYRVPSNGGVEYNKWRNVVGGSVYITLTIYLLCGCVSQPIYRQEACHMTTIPVTLYPHHNIRLKLAYTPRFKRLCF